jgi:fructokinase
MKRQPVVIGIGELLWDMLPTGKKVGGAPVNFAYHASRMGAAGYAISAVGFDQLGDELLREIDKAGINTIIERVDYPTGTVQVELNDGMPDYTINEGVAWDHIPLTWAMEQLVAKADAVCFGTLAQRSEISRKTIMRLLSSAPADAYRILDINIRRDYYSKELVTDSLRSCNVLKINDEELMLLKRLYGKEQDTDEALSRWLLDQYKLIFFDPYRRGRLQHYLHTPGYLLYKNSGSGRSGYGGGWRLLYRCVHFCSASRETASCCTSGGGREGCLCLHAVGGMGVKWCFRS